MIINLVCYLFGHNWDKSKKYEQPCKRKGCLAYRTLMYSRFNHWKGKKAMSWRIFEPNQFKIP